MRGRADADGGVAKSNAKKRDLDDALQVGLGAANPDAKRRHTAGGQGARDDDGAPNSSSFDSSRQDVKRHGTSQFYNPFQIDTLLVSSRPSSSLPALQRQHSLRPPNSTGSAVWASGAAGASFGAKPGPPGGVFSGLGRPTRNQNPLLNGQPTSSSTSSDASSIPNASGGNLATIASKKVPKTSFHSLRYGHKQVDRAAAGKGSPQNQDRTDQGAGFVATSPQRRPSDAREAILPASRIKEKECVFISSSSEDGSHVSEDGGHTDKDDDKRADSLANARQGRARARGRSSGDSLLKADPDGVLNGERKAKQPSYDKTPSGKGYRVLSSESLYWAAFALYPANVFQAKTGQCGMRSLQYFLTDTGRSECLA